VRNAEPKEATKEKIGEVTEETVTEKAIVSLAETERKEVENADVEELEIELDPVGLSDDIQKYHDC
jgi:uncharacterized sporulation protein YeaH/YhbH (DUF444 family)